MPITDLARQMQEGFHRMIEKNNKKPFIEALEDEIKLQAQRVPSERTDYDPGAAYELGRLDGLVLARGLRLKSRDR